MASATIAMVLAVYWPPHEPADGQATRSSSSSVFVVHLADGMEADGLEQVLHDHVAAAEAARQDASRHR